MTTLRLAPVPGRLRRARLPFCAHLQRLYAPSERGRLNWSLWGNLGFTLFKLAAFLSHEISATLQLRRQMGVCEQHRAKALRWPPKRHREIRQHPLKQHTFPCHSSLARLASGFVPLFAVHLAASAPFRVSQCLPCPLSHVHSGQCRGWAFPDQEQRRQFASFWDKHLQTDTKQRLRLKRLNYSAFI